MKRVFFASSTRLIGWGSPAAAIVCYGLFAYCGYVQYSFWAGAEPLPATVTSLYRLPVDDQHARAGHRMTVEFADPQGQMHVVPLNGLYRTARGETGKTLTVYYNSRHPVRVALHSPWNWAGPALYGTLTVALLL